MRGMRQTKSMRPIMQATDCLSAALLTSMDNSLHRSGHIQSFPSDDPDPQFIDVDAFDRRAVDAFQRRAADLLTNLLSEGPSDLLSIAWTRHLLDAFVICLWEFRALFFSPEAAAVAARTPVDHLVADFLDRAVKTLDLCNAIRYGLDVVRQCRKHLAIATAALASSCSDSEPAAQLREAQIRRARKALTELTILMMPDVCDRGRGVLGHSNKDTRACYGQSSSSSGSSGSDSGSHIRSSLSWSVSQAWSAAWQLQAIERGLPTAAPHSEDIAATGFLASAVHTMGAMLFIVAFTLVAAVPCQGRSLQIRVSVPRNFPWSDPVKTLYERILEEYEKKERQNSCGLLKEIHQMELCSRHLLEITDAAEFPLPHEKNAEVREAAQELVQFCESLGDGLDRLELQVKEMFRQIVLTTEILYCLDRPRDTDKVPRSVPTLMDDLFERFVQFRMGNAGYREKIHSNSTGKTQDSEKNLALPRGPKWKHDKEVYSPVTKLVDQVQSMHMSASRPPLQPISVGVGPRESSTEGMMNSSQGSMEARVSSSLGAMGSVLRKLGLLLAPMYPLRSSLKHAIKLLMEDLEEIRDALVDQSMVDSPKNKAKYWMEEVRGISYDIEDSIDVMMLHTANNVKVRSINGHRHRVARLKIRQVPKVLKLSMRIARVAELRTLLWEASERHERYQLDGCIRKPPRFVFSSHSSWIPVVHKVAGNLIGMEGPKKELTMWLTNQAERQLKVLCIVGAAGVGKTTLAKELFRELGAQFECQAFIRVLRSPNIHRLLQELISQIHRPKQNSETFSPQSVIDDIRKHLQDKRYFIVIDGLWEAEAWDIIKVAFPKGNNCSRIIITAEVQNLAAKCSGYHVVDVFELKPLGSNDSEKLFLGRVFGFEGQCPDPLKGFSCRMVKECGGLPLAIIAVAGLLERLRDNPDLWQQLLQYVFSSLENLSLEDMLKETVNLCYDNLPQDLKTCLLYLTMYPEGCTIWKLDLLKQWTAEGFITSMEGNERVGESYFDELVSMGMIQPEQINYNNEVLSCTIHHIVRDIISHKSREENFITEVDYAQNIEVFFMKARRLSLHFSCAQYATKPEGIMMSQVRSLAFFGILRCMPSVMEFKLLRVLILEIWGDNDDCTSLNLSKICGLLLLRYLKISSHMFVELPSKIQRLKLLETLEIDAKVSAVPNEQILEKDTRESAVPNDIVHLPGLLHLSIQDGTKLPDRIGRILSLQTLKYFDLGNNSEDNVHSLGELINLRDLHLTCSTALSVEHLKRNLIALASSLGRLAKLKTLTLAHGAVGMTMFADHATAMFYTLTFLQRLELLPPMFIFSRLPEWIGKLHELRILKIVVRVLLRSDIYILTGLPGLTVLSLYVRQSNAKTFVFNSGALPVLNYFKYKSSALRIAFQEDALPNLSRLKLCFNVRRGEICSPMISGVEHMLNLNEIAVRFGAAAGSEESDRRAVESAFQSTIRKHPRFPICMNVRRVDWVE